MKQESFRKHTKHAVGRGKNWFYSLFGCVPPFTWQIKSMHLEVHWISIIARYVPSIGVFIFIYDIYRCATRQLVRRQSLVLRLRRDSSSWRCGRRRWSSKAKERLGWGFACGQGAGRSHQGHSRERGWGAVVRVLPFSSQGRPSSPSLRANCFLWLRPIIRIKNFWLENTWYILVNQYFQVLISSLHNVRIHHLF
jgi:hypothetical protein